MIATHYKSGRQVEDAMAVVAGFISNNRKIDVRYHNGTAVDADIFAGKIRIPKLACASGIAHDDLMVFRGRVYHEAGHIDITDLPKSKYPAGALFNIWNAIEDVWMEAEEAKKHEGCRIVFRHNAEFHNKKIGERIMANGVAGPLFEAMVAMMFRYEGLQPSWELSEKAKAYFDAAYKTFSEVALSKNSDDNLVLAKRILKILKQASKDFKEQNPEEEKPQQPPPPQQPPQNDEEDGEDNEDAQAGCAGDVDDEEQDEQPQQSGEPQQSDEETEEGDDDSETEPGAEGEPKDGDEDDDSEDSKAGSESDDDEEGDETESGSGSDGEDEDSDDETSDSDSDEGEDSDDKGGDESEASDTGSDSDEESDSDSDSDGDEDSLTPQTSKSGGDDKDTSENDEDDEDGGDLEDEIEGLSREEALDEKIEEIIQNIDPEDSEYLSRRDLDQHVFMPIEDRDKETFKTRRDEVSVMVATMTRTLEQALRAMARNRNERFLRQGRIDKRRLVQIARGLSKEVFHKVREGSALNTAVVIVIDESGSMGNAYIPVQLLAMAIGEALSAIGVPFEIIGTTTNGQKPPLDGMTRTQPIVYKHYKGFDEEWQSVRYRIVHTSHHLNNIDGEAVEYAAFRLAGRRENRKVIFSLSDGMPFGGQGMEAELCENLIRVCERCRKSGTEVYGFGVMTQEPSKYYGEEFFIHLDSVTTIGPTFARKFAEIITKGSVRM